MHSVIWSLHAFQFFVSLGFISFLTAIPLNIFLYSVTRCYRVPVYSVSFFFLKIYIKQDFDFFISLSLFSWRDV